MEQEEYRGSIIHFAIENRAAVIFGTRQVTWFSIRRESFKA
jgi:hypothetical protein